MDKITKRLAISDIDFETINISLIFKIIESFVNEKIEKITQYETKSGCFYAIADFKDENSAKDAYELLDGTEVETTGVILNLSFVPDNFELDNVVEECKSSENYKKYSKQSKKIKIDENMIEMSDEISINFEIPDEFKSETVSIENQKVNNSDKKEDDSQNEVLSKLKEGVDQLQDDFHIDIDDDRFKALFEDDDYMIDSSNKKSKLQKASRMIIEEKLKRTSIE